MSKKVDSEFSDKWMKVLKGMPDFKDTADSSSAEDLKKMIVACEGNISVIEKEKSDDLKLAGARELASEYSKTYAEGIKVQMAKIKYSIFLLEGKGAI